MPRLGLVGAGAWGTALAVAAARAGHEAVLWGRDADAIAEMRARRESRAKLPGIGLPAAVRPTAYAAELRDLDPILLTVPAQALRTVARDIVPAGARRLVICAKGLERATGLRLGEVVAAVRPEAEVAVLSGPSYAGELARGLPTAVTLGARDLSTAQALCRLLAGPAFRLYPSDDVLGVEIGGALKNVVAIAAGAVMGLELGENARAAVITRGLAEMARLAEALGARRETLLGLSGVGDLLLTATSLTSRNTRFGHELARGASVAELTGSGRPLAEGAWTAEAALRLAAPHGVELPITDAVARVVGGRWTVGEAIEALLSRPLAAEE
jgi:glycerol-3-phosphate dehydrogenase (NAD(P)+)